MFINFILLLNYACLDLPVPLWEQVAWRYCNFTVLFKAYVTLVVHTHQWSNLRIYVTPDALSLGVTMPKFSRLAMCQFIFAHFQGHSGQIVFVAHYQLFVEEQKHVYHNDTCLCTHALCFFTCMTPPCFVVALFGLSFMHFEVHFDQIVVVTRCQLFVDRQKHVHHIDTCFVHVHTSLFHLHALAVPCSSPASLCNTPASLPTQLYCCHVYTHVASCVEEGIPALLDFMYVSQEQLVWFASSCMQIGVVAPFSPILLVDFLYVISLSSCLPFCISPVHSI